MTTFAQVQDMATKQAEVIESFNIIKKEILALSHKIKSSEPKTASFLEGFAEGGFKSMLNHYLLESRHNLSVASEEIKLDEILGMVNKESLVNNNAIVALKKSPDA